jgi:TrmH family RNA methyltransferase
MEVITSPSNHTIKEIAALKMRKNRESSSSFIVEGQKMIQEAKKSGAVVSTFIFDSESKKKDQYLHLAEDYEKQGIRVIAANERVLKAVCDTITPQGVAAVCQVRSIEPQTIGLYDIGLVLDRVRDPGNLGTIIRCAEAMGIDWVIAAGCADLYNQKTIRATMGSVFRQKVLICEDALPVLRSLKEKGYKLYGAALKPDSVSVEQIAFTSPCAVMIGNEGSGLSQECLDLCSSNFIIPMSGEVESLNAAVCAGIIMWEIAKKKGS